MKKINITKEFLIKEYITNKKSCKQIAKELQCDATVIWKRLRKYNIKTRTLSEAIKGLPRITKANKILTKEFLYKEYIINKKSTVQIAKQLNCDKSTVYTALKRNNIIPRTHSEAQGDWLNILTKKFLIKEYLLHKKSIRTIANEIGCSCNSVYMALKRHNIKRRTQREATQGKFKGINNPNYIHGHCYSFYPIEFNNILKASISERDNYICQICGKSTKKNGRVLDIHHIDYIKSNLDPLNLISLCRNCHMKTNPKKNRNIYIEFFKILKETINVY